ncbi:MAG: ThiF family adenylyltransferase [Bacilli bacterium]|nr:ThiF family adenylyltransferase [Bacilli bacterium]
MRRFERLEKLISKEKTDLLKNKSVLVLGIGGVGGYVVESLARSNIGKLIIVDGDIVDETNINRQIIALESTIGKKKVDVFKDRLIDINKDIEVITIDKFIDDTNIDELFNYDIDYFVDACDTINTKKLVIKNCIDKNINLISSMGTGNRMDPSKLEITTLDKTNNDPIAKILRKYVRDEHINKKIKVLCSTEIPMKVDGVGSNSFVPCSAGLLITSDIIKDLIK